MRIDINFTNILYHTWLNQIRGEHVIEDRVRASVCGAALLVKDTNPDDLIHLYVVYDSFHTFGAGVRACGVHDKRLQKERKDYSNCYLLFICSNFEDRNFRGQVGIILHELGHIALGHLKSDVIEGIRIEVEADLFAASFGYKEERIESLSLYRPGLKRNDHIMQCAVRLAALERFAV